MTQFDTAQEEVCEENFEKSCQVTFKQQAFNETVKKCYKPIEKVCDGTEQYGKSINHSDNSKN